MRILVTGANGYIGRHVVANLLQLRHDVIACDIHLSEVDDKAKKIEYNLFNSDEMAFQKLGKPDICVHLAWRNGFTHNADTHIADLSNHFTFLTNMVKGGLKHLAVMGTMHEVGYWEGAIDENTPCNPLSMYGIAKDSLRRAMTLFCTNNNCLLQWLRGFYILGDDTKNHSIFTKLLEADKEGKKEFPFTTGKTKYDFITVDELATQIAAAATQTEVSGIINCCSGHPISLAERVEQYIKEHHLNIKLIYGKYPDRPYDSPIIYGNATKIERIIHQLE